MALRLSAARRQASSHLRAAVERCLRELAMEQSRFDVRIGWEVHDGAPPASGAAQALVIGDGAVALGAPRPAPARCAAEGGIDVFCDAAGVRAGEEADQAYSVGEGGLDRVEFLLAAGPAEPLRPLRNVASGGESARIMLALKAAPKIARAAGMSSVCACAVHVVPARPRLPIWVRRSSWLARACARWCATLLQALGVQGTQAPVASPHRRQPLTTATAALCQPTCPASSWWSRSRGAAPPARACTRWPAVASLTATRVRTRQRSARCRRPSWCWTRSTRASGRGWARASAACCTACLLGGRRCVCRTCLRRAAAQLQHVLCVALRDSRSGALYAWCGRE